MPTLDALFDRFLRERTYLKNISPKTRVWYQTAWTSFTTAMPSGFTTVERDDATPIIRADLSAFVVALRDRNVRPVSVNTWLRAINAFCRWLHEEGLAKDGVRLKPLRLERRLVQTIDAPGLRLLLAYRPRALPNFAFTQSRARSSTQVAGLMNSSRRERRPSISMISCSRSWGRATRNAGCHSLSNCGSDSCDSNMRKHGLVCPASGCFPSAGVGAGSLAMPSAAITCRSTRQVCRDQASTASDIRCDGVSAEWRGSRAAVPSPRSHRGKHHHEVSAPLSIVFSHQH